MPEYEVIRRYIHRDEWIGYHREDSIDDLRSGSAAPIPEDDEEVKAQQLYVIKDVLKNLGSKTYDNLELEDFSVLYRYPPDSLHLQTWFLGKKGIDIMDNDGEYVTAYISILVRIKFDIGE